MSVAAAETGREKDAGVCRPTYEPGRGIRGRLSGAMPARSWATACTAQSARLPAGRRGEGRLRLQLAIRQLRSAGPATGDLIGDLGPGAGKDGEDHDGGGE